MLLLLFFLLIQVILLCGLRFIAHRISFLNTSFICIANTTIIQAIDLIQQTGSTSGEALATTDDGYVHLQKQDYWIASAR